MFVMRSLSLFPAGCCSRMPVSRYSLAQSSAGIQTMLANESDQKYSVDMNAYMKGVISCRGVKAPAIKRIVKEWKAGVSESTLHKDTGFDLMSSEYLEDKIAGAILLQESYSSRDSRCYQQPLDHISEIQRIEQLFNHGLVPGWAATDSICHRPLATLVKSASGQPEGTACSIEQCCAEILSWRHTTDVWKARAAVVTFVPFARKPALYERFQRDLLEAAAVTVKHPERFVQLGTGWMLRDLGKQDAEAMLTFCRTHLYHFSAEGLRATADCLAMIIRRRYGLCLAGPNNGFPGLASEAATISEAIVGGSSGSVKGISHMHARPRDTCMRMFHRRDASRRLLILQRCYDAHGIVATVFHSVAKACLHRTCSRNS
eukprot:jgi/Ulvmu1/5272/UM022_0066.1